MRRGSDRVRRGSDSSASACITAGPSSNPGSAPKGGPVLSEKQWGNKSGPSANGWMNECIVRKNIENKQKEWLMLPNLFIYTRRSFALRSTTHSWATQKKIMVIPAQTVTGIIKAQSYYLRSCSWRRTGGCQPTCTALSEQFGGHFIQEVPLQYIYSIIILLLNIS